MTSIRHGYVVLGCTCAHNDAGRRRDKDCPKHGDDTLSYVQWRKVIEKQPRKPPGVLPSGLRTATQCWKCKIPVFHDEAISGTMPIRDGMVRVFTYCKPCYYKFVEPVNRRRDAVMATRKKRG